jgi:hypothetical protein
VALQDTDDAGAVDMMEHAHAVAATMAATAEAAYPLVDKSKNAAKKFAGNFTTFWGRLVPACADAGLLFGPDNVVDKITAWLTTISRCVMVCVEGLSGCGGRAASEFGVVSAPTCVRCATRDLWLHCAWVSH